MNPFTERGRITEPARFIGRWREVSLTFERLERRRPVLVSGGPGIGKSSLLTHVAQSAGAVLEQPFLAAFYLDLAVLPNAETALRLIVQANGGRGNSVPDLEEALVATGRPAIVTLDNVQAAIAAGWGADLLERLARLARRSVPFLPEGAGPAVPGTFDLLLMTAHAGPPPPLSEPFATFNLGAMDRVEVRLLTDTYLDGTEVSFSSADLHEIRRLSIGHPAYVQRAAYHLFEAYTRPDYDWRAAYLAEATERPVPGAPLPPEVFAGESGEAVGASSYGELSGEGAPVVPEAPPPVDLRALIGAVVPLVVALLILQISASWPAALIVLVGGYLAVGLLGGRNWRREEKE